MFVRNASWCLYSIRPSNIRYVPLRGIGGFYEPAPTKQTESIHGKEHVQPLKPVITIPVPVQERALKRHRKAKNMKAYLDKEFMSHKPLVISSRRKELNYRKGQQYGRFETLPLVSAGWYHRKSIGDFFSIQSVLPHKATNFINKKDENKRQPTFSDYELHPSLVQSLAKCGFTKSTNIQHEAIPKILEYSDAHALIAAETGNGKTLAMVIPILHHVMALKTLEKETKIPNNSPYAVIVTPGRELADQFASVTKSLADNLGLRVHLFKGSKIRKQIDGPKEPMDIVVGSFGGLNKLFHEGYLKPMRVAYIALDEVDTLLDDTFKDETLKFLQKFGHTGLSLISGVKVLMAGATFPSNFDVYMSELMTPEDILKISTDQIHKVMLHVPQKFMRVSCSKKTETLLEVLEKDVAKKNKVVIFSNKGSTATFVYKFLQDNNINCALFNKGVGEIMRRKYLDSFITGEVKVISATDLMSRGLDTHDVHHVINYDFPLNPADYIHRAGRVGRVKGCPNGRVTSFVRNEGEAKVLQNIETSVRKSTEIQNVNNNIIRIIQFRKERYEKRKELKKMK